VRPIIIVFFEKPEVEFLDYLEKRSWKCITLIIKSESAVQQIITQKQRMIQGLIIIIILEVASSYIQVIPEYTNLKL
jgi:hypothetical protein